MQLGRRVAAVRDQLPGTVTQGEIASRTLGQLSRSAIANIETGRHRVALHQLYLLAGALGCRVEELLPSSDALRSAPTVPLGAGPDDASAAEMMEKLQRGRDITVLDDKREA